jgi:hypothetical protein
MPTFNQVEKVRAVRRIVALKKANHSAQVDTAIYDQYIADIRDRLSSS